MFEKLKQGFARYALKALNIENNYGTFHYDSFQSYGTVQNRLIEIMSGCTEILDGSKNPLDWLQLSDVVFIEIPFVQRAIQKRSAFIGRVECESTLPDSAEVQRVVSEANLFIQNCPLLKEEVGTPRVKTGLSTLAYQIVETCQRSGMVFMEERFDEQGDFLGILRFNPRNFYFRKIDINKSELYYNTQKVDISSPFFQYLALEYEDGFDWGKPLIYGGAWASESFAKVVNAESSSATRHANPATLTTIANNDPKVFETVKNEEGKWVLTPVAQMWSDIVASIRNSVAKGLKDMANGKGSHTVVTVPGKDLTITSQAYGDNITGSGVSKNTLDFFSILLANALDMPVELLSILTQGGGGFSGERFKMIMDSQGDWITATRTDVAPVILRIIKNHLRRMKMNPKIIDSLKIEWLYSNYETAKERAEIEKIEAETYEKIMNVVEKMAMINPAAAYAFAAENGIIIE